MFAKTFFCDAAEQYCRSYMCDGVVGCEACSEYKGYCFGLQKEKERKKVEGGEIK